MTNRMMMDIETVGADGSLGVAFVTQAESFRLTYLTPDHDLRDLPHSACVRTKDFDHLGAAIVWARRKLFRKEVSGDHIELSVRLNGSEVEAYDIRLGEIVPWFGADPVDINMKLRGIKRCKPRYRRTEA